MNTLHSLLRLPTHLWWCGLLIALSIAENALAAGDHAAVLLYHHVSETTPPSTSVSPAVFESHLDYIEKHGYSVLPLADIAVAIRDGQPLPPRSVAITFDDAFQSVLTQASPLLLRRGWPFTIFVASDPIDKGYAGYLTWDELRQLAGSGATIENHSQSHAHLLRRLDNESHAKWQQRVARDINEAAMRIKDELGYRPQLLAWPYGEFDAELETIAEGLGYVSFGQQSGPAGRTSGLQSLPRFPLATAYAAIDSLSDKLRTRPLPIEAVTPSRRVLGIPAAAPQVSLTIPAGPYRREALRCYVAGQEPATIRWSGDVATITAQSALRAGRGKFNCTAPALDDPRSYYWYSHLWLQPNDDGSWYAE